MRTSTMDCPFIPILRNDSVARMVSRRHNATSFAPGHLALAGFPRPGTSRASASPHSEAVATGSRRTACPPPH